MLQSDFAMGNQPRDWLVEGLLPHGLLTVILAMNNEATTRSDLHPKADKKVYKQTELAVALEETELASTCEVGELILPVQSLIDASSTQLASK